MRRACKPWRQWEQAATYFRQAGEQALARSAHREHAPAHCCAIVLIAMKLSVMACVRCQTIEPKSQTLLALPLYWRSIIVDRDRTILVEMQDGILRA